MFQMNLWCYLWDLVDEGIDEVLDQLKGEAGVTGISVAVFYHSIDQLRPHVGVSPRTFRSKGGAQFKPTAKFYEGTRVRPLTASWLRKRDPLENVAEACAKRGLTLRAWMVCNHSSLMVRRYESCAVKNVFEDIDPTWLCPINPDVREYLRSMIEDLSEHYPLETIELERPSFQEQPHAHAHHKIGFEVGEVGRWLCNLCFCESCRQSAERSGIDVEAAARSAKVTLERVFASGKPVEQRAEEFIAEDPVLESYANWRCDQVASLVKAIKQSCRSRLVVHRAGGRLLAAVDFKKIAPNCDALLMNCPHADREGIIETVLKKCIDEAGDISKVELGFSACTPTCPDEATFIRSISQAAALGVRSVNIYNYGLLPLSRLEWIKRASRYARRQADTTE